MPDGLLWRPPASTAANPSPVRRRAPRSRVEAVRIVDMSTSNSWAEPTCGAAAGACDRGHRAHIEKFERLGGDEGEDFLFWLGAVQFREYIGIEQPNHHNETSRTGISARFGAMSISRCGEACMAAIRASPVRSPLRRRNSSADMTTTSSRPCTVTRCGPSLRTRRTNSLNRALASCNIHWPNFGSRARRRDFVGFVRDDFYISSHTD